MSNQSDLAKSAAGFNGDPLSIDTANNLVGIGTSSPNARLEVEDGGTGKSVILKVTADDTIPYTFVIGNDTFSTSDTDGLAMWVGNDGEAKIDARGAGAYHTFRVQGTERMRIDTAGRVTMPYQPAFRAYRNTDPGTNTTFGNMSWSGTEFNVGNHFANNKFTAPVSGTYLFGVNNNMGSGYSIGGWRIYKNGSTSHVLSFNDFTASWKNASGSTLIQLQANDYVEAWWRGDADYDIDWCGFFGCLMG